MPQELTERFQIEETVRLSNGESYPLPIRYLRASSISASFSASLPRVRELLGVLPLDPVVMRPGRTVVVLAALEYGELTDARGRAGAPYNELVVMFPVYRERASHTPLLPLLTPARVHAFDLYVHQMPVTTELARVLGVDVWGFPKILADIEVRDERQSRRATLRVGGRDVLSFAVETMRTRADRAEYHNLGVRNGEVVRGVFEIEGELGVARFRGGASWELGDHPIADELRRLELGRFAYHRGYAPSFHGLLHAPTPPVRPLRPAPEQRAPSEER